MKALLVWLSDPSNIVALSTAIGLLISTVINVAQKLKLVRVVAVAEAAQAGREEATSALVAVSQGVEEVKKAMTPREKKATSLTIQGFTEAAGVEHLVAPVVSAVQAGAVAEVIVRKATDRLDPGTLTERLASAVPLNPPTSPGAAP